MKQVLFLEKIALKMIDSNLLTMFATRAGKCLWSSDIIVCNAEIMTCAAIATRKESLFILSTSSLGRSTRRLKSKFWCKKRRARRKFSKPSWTNLEEEIGSVRTVSQRSLYLGAISAAVGSRKRAVKGKEWGWVFGDIITLHLYFIKIKAFYVISK